MIPKTINFVNEVLQQVNADDCEVLFTKQEYSLTRFAQSHIHQSTNFREQNLHIRLIRNGRVGAVSTNCFGQDSISFAIKRAEEMADAQPEPDSVPTLTSEQPIAETKAYHEITARAGPYDRADVIRSAIKVADARKAVVSGAVANTEEAICIVNSRGTESYEHFTWAELNLLAERDGLTGYAYWRGEDFSEMPHRQLAQEAVTYACFDEPMAEVTPGQYTVIFDTYAVGEIVGFLAESFGAKTFLEKRSFLTQKLGKKISSPKITLLDDASHPQMVRTYFDFEGVAKKRVPLINSGFACGMVTDSATAPKVEAANTGHALPAPNSTGPLPCHLVLEPGNSSLDKMIRTTKDGIYVRRLHYVNVVEPMRVVLTGMTKDGTFLIRDGKLVNPVRNLRFTESALRALNNVLQVGSDRRLVEGVTGPVLAPALKIRDFTFTGATEQ